MSTEDDKKKVEKKVIEVTVKDDNSAAILQQNDRLLDIIENEKLNVKTSDSDSTSEDDLEKHKQQAFNKFHQERFKTATTQDELNRMVDGYLEELQRNAKHEASSGDVGLSDAQYGKSQRGKGTYKDLPSLIRDLHDREKLGGADGQQAKKMLDLLYKKTFEHAKQNNVAIPSFQKPEPEFEENGFGQKVLVNPEDSDLYELTHGPSRRALKKRQRDEGQTGDQ
jgi:hypothetical protein